MNKASDQEALVEVQWMISHVRENGGGMGMEYTEEQKNAIVEYCKQFEDIELEIEYDDEDEDDDMYAITFRKKK